MTSFTVNTFKENLQASEIHWSNKFVVDAITFEQALDQAEIIAAGEQNCMWDNYRVVRVTAKSYLGGQTRVRPVDLVGTRTPGVQADQLPLFNTVRILLTPATGRVFSHYMRFVLAESDVDGFNVNADMRDLISAQFLVNYLELTAARSVNGEVIVDNAIQIPVQMRQLGSHRRHRPGFKRGWVAE